MRFSKVLKNILAGLLMLVLSMGTIELILKTFFSDYFSPYNVFKKITRKQRRFSQLPLYKYIHWDKDLIYAFQPNLPHLEDFFNYSLIQDAFEVRTNSEGFRYPPDSTIHQMGITPQSKIVCLGESWTMGWGVPASESYPEQLGRMLKQAFPDKPYSVFNLGAITYTSFQGVVLTKRILPALKSGDIVIIGYNANDSRHGFTFHNVYSGSEFLNEKSFHNIVFRMTKGFTTFKVIRTLINLSLPAIRPGHDRYFWEFNPRVPTREYYANHKEMIRLIRAKKAIPILLYHGLMREEDYTKKVLYQVSQQTHTPLVETHTALVRKIDQMTQKDEEAYPQIRPNTVEQSQLTNTGEISLTLRLAPLPTLQLLRLVPNDIARIEAVQLDWSASTGYAIKSFELNDTGIQGDEQANDGIWSGTVIFRPDLRFMKLSPVYVQGTFTGEYKIFFFFYFRIIDRQGKAYPEITFAKEVPLYVGLWRELCIGKVPKASRDSLPYKSISPTQTFYYKETTSPLYFFGRRRFRSEFLHPNKEGYRFFAEELCKKIKSILTDTNIKE